MGDREQNKVAIDKKHCIIVTKVPGYEKQHGHTTLTTIS